MNTLLSVICATTSTAWSTYGDEYTKQTVGKIVEGGGVEILSVAYAAIGILGVVGIVWGAYNLVTSLISQGRKPVSWPMVALSIIIGGIMTFGGWSMFAGTIAAGGAATVDTWGKPVATAPATTDDDDDEGEEAEGGEVTPGETETSTTPTTTTETP